MRSLRWQKGEGKGAIIFWLLVFAAAGVIGKEWIPAKIADMQLRDHVDEMAKLYPRHDAAFFREQIVNRAKELYIPLKAEDVQVEKNLKRVRVRFTYTVPMDLIVTTWNLPFKHELERDIFLI